MKKFFFFAIAVLGMMTGCRKAEMDPVKNQVDDSDRVAVQFAVDAPSLTITKTKGTGAVEEWASQDLYILGYERAAETFELGAGTTLIPNIVADAPASSTDGKITVIHPNDHEFAREPYYYADGKVYDFYGYYVDDAAGQNTLAANANGASIDLEIDGTQDIMAAKADPGLDVVSGVAERNAYSAYAARRGVHPTLTFEHMLTRFNFHAVAGAASGKDVTIEEVTLDSYKAVTLTVAPVPALAKDADAEKSDFVLDGVTSAAAYVNGNDPESYEYDYAALLESGDAEIGNSMMVVAGETSHTITLTTKLIDKEQTIDPLVITLNAEDVVTADGKRVEMFEAGYQYDIILTVYGPEEVEITAVLTEWKEGGSTVVDPDKWMEEPTEVSAYVSAATDNSLTYTIETPNDYVKGQATLYAAGAPVGDPKEFVPTKAKTAEVTFEGLTAGTPYSLEVKVATTADANYNEIEPVTVAPVAPGNIVITDAFYVCDKDSYNRLPESYRSQEGNSWGEYLAAYKIYESDPENHSDFVPLPWLAVTILPLETDATATVNGKTVNFPIPAKKTLVTIAPSEIEGIDSFEAGKTYTVAITSADETVSVDITVPGEAADEPAAPAFDVTKSYVVVNTPESWAQMPASYLERFPWADDLLTNPENAHLPYLAAEFTPVKTLNVVVKDAEGNDLWTKSYTKENEFSFLTISNREDELNGQLVSGDYTVILTSNEVSEEVRYTVE